MLELSLQFCFDEGLPAPLRPESYDCEAPSGIADENTALDAKGTSASSTETSHMNL